MEQSFQPPNEFLLETGASAPEPPHEHHPEHGWLPGRPIAEEERSVPEPRERSFLGRLGIAEWLLKHREYLLEQIESGREIHVILADLLLVAILPTAFYGLVTGIATNTWARILSNPLKLPLVLIFSMCLCLPTLYIFSSLLGSRRSFLQTTALGFSGLAIMGVILAAFAPITWFLTFTAPRSHALHVLVSVAVLGLGGAMGVRFMFSGIRRFHAGKPDLRRQVTFLRCWMVLYGMVGAQMGYLMAPFFSHSHEWFVYRGAGSETVFSSIFALLRHLLS